MKKTVADLVVEWPPLPGVWARGGDVGPLPENVTVTEVLRHIGNQVDFSGRFGNHVVRYSCYAPDEVTAEELVKLITNSLGRSVFDIGQMEMAAS